MSERSKIVVRTTRPEDFTSITEICRRVYPNVPPWGADQLASHLKVFPEGQLVVVAQPEERVLGMASSLIVQWDDYDVDANWRDMTDSGYFTNHDPEGGRTLYGAEIMIDPEAQGRGAGSALYRARRELAERLHLRRIRAGARLRDYHRYADKLSAEEYVRKVIHGELGDRTLSFQLKHGFRVLAVVSGYLRNDPESLGYAAVIEWINEKAATAEDLARQRQGITSHHLD